MTPKSRCLLVAVLTLAVACSDDQTIPFGQSQPDAADTTDAGGSDATGPDGLHSGPDDSGGSDDPDGSTNPDVGADTTPVSDTEPGDAPADDPDTSPDTPAEDTAGDAAPDADADPDADPDTDVDDDPPELVRFVAFGDWGVAAISRITTAADAMWTHCQEAGCDFVLGLGDNFYDTGVTGVDDPQWETKLEVPFADWDIPFYMSLGNHDYLGNEAAQVAYTDLSDRWTMPARYFDLIAGPVHFFALDTNSAFDAQRQWLEEAIPESEAPWLIGFGHHPWRSHGVHGSATGTRRALYEWAFCDRIDFWITGHDHDLQHLEPDCGVELVISGAVATLRTTESGPDTLFAASEYGFVWLELSADRAIVEFHDLDGNLLHRTERDRPDRTPSCVDDDYCASGCASDPDCSGLDCAEDGVCERRCSSDSDCFMACPCDFNDGLCEPLEDPSALRCACDPECRGSGRPCQADDHCDTWCPDGIDPDCP